MVEGPWVQTQLQANRTKRWSCLQAGGPALFHLKKKNTYKEKNVEMCVAFSTA